MARGKKKESTLTSEEKLAQALVPDWEQPYKVPRNWCWAYWGNCGEFIAGNGFKNEYQGFQDLPIPFYKVGSLKYSDLSGYLYDASNTIDEEIRGKLKATIIPKNSVIFAKIGEAIRLNRRSLNAVPCCIDNNLMAFITNGACLYSYAFYWSKGVELYDYTNATTVPAIRKSDLEMIPFPIPPLAEQQRIVDRIEYLFAKLDDAKEKVQSVLDSFETRKAAILHKAFIGELTAKWRAEHSVRFDSWRTLSVSDIGDVITGNTPDTKRPEYYGGEVPFVKPTELNQGRYVQSAADTLTEAGRRVSRPVRAGSTCVCCIGATISKCGLLMVDAVTNQQINTIVPYSFMDDVFVYYYCINNRFKNSLIDNSSSTTLPIINKKKMSALEFVVPLKEEQIEIVRILDRLFAKEQQAKEAAEAVLEKIDLLKKSILARAFRGELGTNDPSEESAVELLKGILEADAPETPKRRSKSIPKELQKKLETELERKIIHLYFQRETESLPAEILLSVSSKKFDVLEALHNLEHRGLIKKLNNGNYRLLG